MLKKTSRPWSVKQFKSMYDKGSLNFDIAIQRKGNIWDKNRQSLLIHSLIVGFPVPPMYTKLENDIYYFIDGKQRMTTVISFLNNEFALTPSTPDIDDDEIAGLSYTELPDAYKTALLKSTFTITSFDNISDTEIEDMFFRLNNGVALKTIESIRVLLGTENMNIVEELANHPFYDKKSSLSKNRYNDQESVLHLFMLSSLDGTGFSSKELRSYVNTIRGKELDKELVSTVKERLDFMEASFDKKRKYLKKLNIPMLFQLVPKAQEKEITPEYFGMWADEFFSTLEKESLYSQASQSGSAKKDNVQKRIQSINLAFEESFNAYNHKEAMI